MRKWWCVSDYEDTFILVRIGVQAPDGSMSSGTRHGPEEYIVSTIGFDQSKDLWEKFNDPQFTKCPWELSK